MKQVVIITHIPFWRHLAGHAARLSALVKFLDQHTALTVVFGGVEQENDPYLLGRHHASLRVVYLNKHRELSGIEYALLLKRFFENRPVDVCIIEYLELSFLLDYIPKGTRVMLDTHDIISERNKSFRQYAQSGNPLPIEEEESVSAEEEFALFNKYDKIILISETDYRYVSGIIGTEKCILAPHPADLVQRPVRPVASSVGFVASEYWPNVEAISGFVEEVWSKVYRTCAAARLPVTLNIYGAIAYRFVHDERPGIAVKGFVADLNDIYGSIDVVINPVRFGAGLKIKSVEALANALPLVTTAHGASGLDAGIDSAFLVADNPGHYCQLLVQLLLNYQDRKALSEAAFAFAKSNFTPQACFQHLLGAIANP